MKKILLLALMCSTAYADTIEEIVVIGDISELSEVDVVETSTIQQTLQPAMVFVPGGIGGFASFTERGTQPNHTVVYRNGVPVNDAGAGWYDLGHDISTGSENVKIVSGPQGVLYGTASMGGTVFINDDIQRSTIARLGSRNNLISFSPLNNVNFYYADADNQSVRTDNTEQDYYRQHGARIQFDTVREMKLTANYQDYTYDFDDCYTESYAPSNDCEQIGQRVNFSLRNDNVTLGYNSNTAEFYTGDYSTYETDAENVYFDARETFSSTNDTGNGVLGITLAKSNFSGNTRTSIEPYAYVNFNDVVDFGLRVADDKTVGRLGLSFFGAWATVSTSYRNPSLYEIYGDGVFVLENNSLDPEEALGYEIGYGPVSVYRYEFTQGVDFDMSSITYINTGEYITEGVRFSDTYDLFDGQISVFAGYTDTDRPRVPESKIALGYHKSFGNLELVTQYAAMFNRGTDYVWQTNSMVELEDVNTLDLFLNYSLTDKFTISMGIEDLLDRSFEITPGYAAGGRQITLTLQLR